MRTAFKQAMGEVAALPKWRAMEVDETCCKVYSELYGATLHNGIRPSERWLYATGPDEIWRCSIDKLPNAAFEGADVWLLSPPCQPFTRTGKKLDTQDARCAPLLRLCEALPKLSRPPRAIFMENVPEFGGSQAHAAWRKALAGAGQAAGATYEVREHVLNSIDFGFPNTRRRYYCTALAAAGDQTAGAKGSSGKGPGKTRISGSETFPVVPVRPVGGFCKEAAVATSALQDLRIPQDLLQKAEKDNWSLDIITGSSLISKTFTAGYGKPEYKQEGLSKAGPILLTEEDGVTPAQEHWPRFGRLKDSHWDRVRYFAPKEIMLLQGYPRDMSLPQWTTTREQWRLIGNSINVAVVTKLLEGLLERLRGGALPS